MTVEEMLNILDKAKDSPFYEICNFISKNNFNQAVICIQDYFKCDDTTAKIIFMDFKTKIYDDLYKPNSQISSAEIAHNSAIAQEWQNKPKCPTCNSTNLKKISATSKVVNTAVFGLFGTKRFKQFHCSNCGYEW